MSLTKVSYSMITGSPVNVMDFFPSTIVLVDNVTTTDVSSYVQEAVDYCVANNRDLVVPCVCKLSSSINIDRPLDNIDYAQLFTVYGTNQGGFYVSTAMPMFSTTFAFTTTPVTGLVRFQDLYLKGTGIANQYMLDDAKFERTYIIGCSFVGVGLLNAPTVYTQSIYIDNCQARYCANYWFYSGANTFDVKVHNCLFEAGAEWLHWVNANGCSIMQNCMEGSALNATPSSAIVIDNCSGLVISGNYFEANAHDVSCLNAIYGLSFTGNYSAEPTLLYSITWPSTAFGCSASGNFCTQAVHYLNTQSRVTINDYSNVDTSNYSSTSIGNQNFTSGDDAATRFINLRAPNGHYYAFGPDASSSMLLQNESGVGVYIAHGGTSWSALSDEREKDVIEPITNALEKVASLRTVIGTYKRDPDKKRHAFFMAQDFLNGVLPEAVDSANPDRLGLSYQDASPLLAAAIRELKEEFEAYKLTHP